MIEVTKRELAQVLAWIRARLKETALSDSEAKKVQLALEEAIVNILAHSGVEKLSMQCEVTPHKIEFELRDRGKPFNPLNHQMRTGREDSLEEREEGGLGIMFMRAYLDELHYRREGEENVLVLIKTSK